MDADHLQRFAGIGRLYGRAGMERLARSSFLVVGLGGVAINFGTKPSWVAVTDPPLGAPAKATAP